MEKIMMKTVLFDLDGTLTDPKEGVVRSMQSALERLGFPVPDESSLSKYIGPPLQHSFAEMLDSKDESLIKKALALYRERYGEVGMFENLVYEGIEKLLSQLSETGYRLYVATSKPKVFADQILDHFELSKYFNAIYGSELDGKFAEKGSLIQHLLESEKLSAADVFMVGDRKFDIEGALKNDLTPVGVLWGYGSLEELQKAGANLVCKTPSDVPSMLTC